MLWKWSPQAYPKFRDSFAELHGVLPKNRIILSPRDVHQSFSLDPIWIGMTKWTVKNGGLRITYSHVIRLYGQYLYRTPKGCNPERFYYTILPSRKYGTLTREFLSWQIGGVCTAAFSWDKAVGGNIESRRTGALSVFLKWGVRHTHAPGIKRNTWVSNVRYPWTYS
jgi:hypothetical protein